MEAELTKSLSEIGEDVKSGTCGDVITNASAIEEESKGTITVVVSSGSRGITGGGWVSADGVGLAEALGQCSLTYMHVLLS